MLLNRKIMGLVVGGVAVGSAALIGIVRKTKKEKLSKFLTVVDEFQQTIEKSYDGISKHLTDIEREGLDAIVLEVQEIKESVIREGKVDADDFSTISSLMRAFDSIAVVSVETDGKW